ncbi:MAG: hypothetical protein LAP87_05555 [Acidobacteriia bacterium]|nr:hypothetical protein [Terriglobia bacterium]
MRRPLAAALLCALLCAGHDVPRNLKPTKAQADLNRSQAALAAAKRKLAAQGRYACCMRPSCNLCARVNGSCNCARNVQEGRGACGECYAGWKAGRGAVKGVDAKGVALLPAEHQACPRPANAADLPSAELTAAAELLLRAKRTLTAEKRFACCIRGGCGQCAHETFCPCGGDLASKKKGVCGDCLDAWHSGQGAFAGIDPAEVTLAPAGADMNAMRAAAGAAGGWYSSGTSQVPAAAPMEMLSRLLGGWTAMATGEMFGIYTDQTGARGRDKIFSTNWFMLMASHRVGPGTLTLRSMLSLEPLTITDRRYPLLFATGETAFGVPIINGQHPHDLFMELAALYQVRWGERASVHLYGGPRGEPALGPTAYPHRLSSSEDPVAVISHHLQDSTHIATNVVTAGITYGPVTWEVSGFHGREPDEKRWGIEGGGIDSLSTRLTVTPTSRWTGQFSIGRINQREATHPLRPSLRTTASVMYVRPIEGGHWATSLIWGRNNDLEYTQLPNVPVFPLPFAAETGDAAGAPVILPRHIVSVPTRIPHQIYNSFLAESTLRIRRNWLWGRAESADKDSTILFEEAPFVLLVDEQRLARVQAYTAGYERELPVNIRLLTAGTGAQFTVYHAPPVLAPIYGSHPFGMQLFVRVRLGGGQR